MKTCAVIFSVVMLVLAAVMPANAQEAKFEVAAFDTVKSVLERNVGKEVILRMVSGPDVQGTVARVGDSVVHISKLSTMNYYDAVIRLEGITAVMVKARGRQ